MFELTEEQKKHKGSIKWLLDEDNRGQGRSTLMAISFIELALENPNKSIKIFDHKGYKMANMKLMDKIKNLLTEVNVSNEKKLTLYHFFEWGRGWIKYNPENNMILKEKQD